MRSAQLHADTREFMLHLDLDVIAQEEFPATNVPGSGGLSFAEVQTALEEFAKHKNLLGWTSRNTIRTEIRMAAERESSWTCSSAVLSARLAALTPVAPAATEETPSATA